MRHFFSLLFPVLFGTFSFGQTTLEYNLEKDAVYTIKQEAKQVITQELDGATHELTNLIDGILEFRVLGQRDSIYDISLTFRDLNLKMTSSIQGELMNVSAREVDETNMQSQIFHSLLDKPVNIALAKNGDILEVKGGNALVAEMAEASGLEDEFSLNMMKKSLEKEFGSEALSNSYKQMTFIYPKKKVKIGSQWKNEYTGKLQAKNVWTLENLSSETASISGLADITMDVTEMTTTMKLSGSQKTRITTDLNSGFIRKMSVEGLSKGASTMAQMGDQEIPTTIESTISYELIAPEVQTN
ncbi:DUF6263 family protein [Pseudozobellia thermophila]|uniref:Uncharacterized protein n=1 Tax=Pseudozobellia thermophila TaxID=192903 RepID=A0A1M6FH72_9FLAO|nr:DUF6263 family protein [Pseudozobellia thermophila]SHI97084.1 hypothetical protein SAMN04488513_102432 [Pseudozobellia thermophila]